MPKIPPDSSLVEPSTGPIKLTIFHTNDMHGHLGAMARLSSFARRLRKEAEADGRCVFLWDAGDAADPQVRICRMSKGVAFASIMNVMGYTLETLGNAIPLTYGPQAIAEIAATADYPILAANLRDGDKPLPEGLSEVALLPLDDRVKVGVLGLTTSSGSLYRNFGMYLPDTFDVARALVRTLRAQGASPVIVLSHLGLNDDRQLAETVEGIDLIIGAHSHDLIPSGELWEGVLITQAGQYAENLGRIDLSLDRETGSVEAWTAQVLEVPQDEPPDPAVIAAIDAAEEGVTAKLSQVIGTLTSPLELNPYRECSLGNLAADALREHMDADAALICSGLLWPGLHHIGDVTRGELESTFSTIVNPCRTVVRGEQIWEALERGLDTVVMTVKHYLLQGNLMGLPQISGFEVAFDPRQPIGERVQLVLLRGEPLKAEREYLIAHTNVDVLPRVGYLCLTEGQRTIQEVPTILMEVIESYFGRHLPVPPPRGGRWVRTTAPLASEHWRRPVGARILW